MAEVVFRDVVKRYGRSLPVVRDLNLEIGHGEFLVLVGPSGCGKSTTLRMLAGLETITEGEILIDGRRVNDVHPRDRDIAMVFQSYALYPHMDVYRNMSLNLKVRNLPQEEIARRVNEAAAILGIERLLNRKPSQLSGGEKQRVAVGRAIVREPKVFLFDEPLSNLDAKLRVQMRSEIASLHKRLGATMVYVTHDQVEAMTLGSRIVVLSDGRAQQVAKPLDLFNHPANIFVAGFIGSPPMNFLHGRIVRDRGLRFVSDEGDFDCPIPEKNVGSLADYENRGITFGIRPEHLRIATSGHYAFSQAPARVESLGSECILYFYLGSNQFVCRLEASSVAGHELRMACPVERAHFFDPATGKRIEIG